jgi:hypothetical protein
MTNELQANIFMFLMNSNSEISCYFCLKRISKIRTAHCNFDECKKLTEWLYDNPKTEPSENKQVGAFLIRYIV